MVRVVGRVPDTQLRHSGHIVHTIQMMSETSNPGSRLCSLVWSADAGVACMASRTSVPEAYYSPRPCRLAFPPPSREDLVLGGCNPDRQPLHGVISGRHGGRRSGAACAGGAAHLCCRCRGGRPVPEQKLGDRDAAALPLRHPAWAAHIRSGKWMPAAVEESRFRPSFSSRFRPRPL